MRDAWIGTFKEMALHTKPEKIKDVRQFRRQYAMYEDEEEEAIDKNERSNDRYRAVLINGQMRNNCTYNAA